MAQATRRSLAPMVFSSPQLEQGNLDSSVFASSSVRGLYIATEQHSSFGGCALGLMLGVLDIVGVEVRNREQVEVRENVEARETEEEDKTRKQQTLRHVMTCG